MTARQFYDWQTAGGAGDVARLVRVLEERGIPWCMMGGLAVNHWSAEPRAMADVDLVIATDRVEEAVSALEAEGFVTTWFPWSVNLAGSSRVSVQVSTAAFHRGFPARSVPADVHGILMRVASREDTLRGKLEAYRDPERRPSRRQEDLADIARMLEAHPDLASAVPEEIRRKLET